MDRKFRDAISGELDATEKRIAGHLGVRDAPQQPPTAYMRQVRQRYVSAPLEQQMAYIQAASKARTPQQVILAREAYEEYWAGRI